MSSPTPLLLAFVLGSVAVCTSSAPETQPDQYVPSEVIVKFRGGSAGAAAVAETLTGGGTTSEQLADFVGALGDKLGVPLEARRVTSGNEVLVGIDLARFAEEAVAKVGAMERVSEAKRVPSGRAGPQTAVTLHVRFAEGQEAAAMAEARGAGEPSHPDLDRFIEAASRELDSTLIYHLEAGDELTVLVNLLAATETLGEKLGALEEVEYAELNQLMQHQGINP